MGDWSQGVPLGYLQALCTRVGGGVRLAGDRGAAQRDPAVHDARSTGSSIHFLHVRSPHPDALPLVLTHGWPGSVLEFEPCSASLTEPEDPADAFHVVVPSLPGYGFSGKPAAPGWGVERIARAWAALMARLGYGRYGAAGSDWGTSISTLLGVQRPRARGRHPPRAAARAARPGDARRPDGRGAPRAGRPRAHRGVGVRLRTRARDPAADDRLRAGRLARRARGVDRGEVPRLDGQRRPPGGRRPAPGALDTLTLYWLTRTGASSARLYWESIRQVDEWIAGEAGAPVDVPAGCTVFPREIQRPSRRWAARRFTDIRHWGEPARGGHFAGLEQPAVLAEELRAFFRLVR